MTEYLKKIQDLMGRLSDQEVLNLYLACERHFLCSQNPNSDLLEIHLQICALENRLCITMMPSVSNSWLLIITVPDLRWLPQLIERVVLLDVFIEQIVPDGGVIALRAGFCEARRAAIALSRLRGGGN